MRMQCVILFCCLYVHYGPLKNISAMSSRLFNTGEQKGEKHPNSSNSSLRTIVWVKPGSRIILAVLCIDIPTLSYMSSYTLAVRGIYNPSLLWVT